MSAFELQKSTPLGRRGSLHTEHGVLETPFFMPVGTAGAMKGITHEELLSLGAQVLLCNTYHLQLQPGDAVIESAGGLHPFIGWNKPILTDSGGYQVFSFAKNGRAKINDDGVKFQNHLNGDALFMGPEESMQTQHALGADIIMCFDECPPSTASRPEIQRAVDRTLRWAKECKRLNEAYKKKSGRSGPLLFGIVQGGLERDLRKKCAEELQAIGFDGYALGGLAVGESSDDMYSVVGEIAPLLPEDAARYLMGVGEREQLKRCVALGIDMFDCVLPMRLARHGTILMNDGSDIRVIASQFRDDHSPIDAESPVPTSRTHIKSYLHHLLKAHERLGETLAQLQNLGVTLDTLKQLRAQIDNQ